MKRIIYELNPQSHPSLGILYKYELHYFNNCWRAICFDHRQSEKPVENRKIDIQEVRKFFKRFGIKKVHINNQMSFIKEYLPNVKFSEFELRRLAQLLRGA